MKYSTNMIGITLLRCLRIVPNCIEDLDIEECEKKLKKLPILKFSRSYYSTHSSIYGTYFAYWWFYTDMDNNLIKNISIEHSWSDVAVRLIGIGSEKYEAYKGKKLMDNLIQERFGEFKTDHGNYLHSESTLLNLREYNY